MAGRFAISLPMTRAIFARRLPPVGAWPQKLPVGPAVAPRSGVPCVLRPAGTTVGPLTVPARPRSSTAPRTVFFTPPESPDAAGRDRDRDGEQTGAVTGGPPLAGVRVDTAGRRLEVRWQQDGAHDHDQAYPFVWLLDNCRCPRCFHPSSLARLTRAAELDLDASPEAAAVSPGGDRLVVRWSAEHESHFPADWLRRYRFDQSPSDPLLDPACRLWGRGWRPRRFDFGRLLADDDALHDWMNELVGSGLALVLGAPRQIGQLHRLGERVSFLRGCNYGETFQVKVKVDPSNVAYTGANLALHTDLAYYIQQPGIQMLHCINEGPKGTGGENVLTDGFKVALDLREQDPEAFRLLTTTEFEFYDVGQDKYGDFYQRSRHPAIRLNSGGALESISISDHSRDPMLRAPVDDVQAIYSALKKFCTMFTDPENSILYKLKDGDILTFNNRRILHGRNAFAGTEVGGRHLEGSYLEWDEVNSRLRVLARNLRENPN